MATVNTSFPRYLFPVCHVGEENKETAEKNIRETPKWGFYQRLNQVEYGNLSACIPHCTDLLFRNDGRQRIVHYLTGALPLLPPTEGTPYDYWLTSDNDKLTRQLLSHQYRYFKLTYNHTYVPVPLLIEHLQESLQLETANKELEPNQSTVISYVQCYSSKVSHNGYLIYGCGPNLNNITIGVLTDHSTDKRQAANNTSYYEYINREGPVRLSCIETLQLPGRIKQIDVKCINDQMLIAARTDYYIVFLEGPSKVTERLIRKKWTDISLMSPSPVELIKPLEVYHTTVLTSCVTSCPYYYGEGLFMTETGGLYLWNINEGVTEVQSPLLDSVDTSQVSHVWSCIWGPHPRSVIVSETKCVSLIEFRNNELTYTPLIEQDSQYLVSNWIITSLAGHPLNPFYVFVATSDKVLLFDTRQPHEPLLEIRHELSKTVRYMGVVCLPWQPEETTVLLCTLHGPHAQVINIKGGYSVSGSVVIPPYVSISIHTVDTNRTLANDMNIQSPHLSHRLNQNLMGACLIPLPLSETVCGVFVTFIGDLFYQCWRYGPHPPLIDPVVPYIPAECKLWVEQVILMEKEMENMKKHVHRQDDIVKDFTLLQKYILSDLSDNRLCMRCIELIKDTLSTDLPHYPPPPTDGLTIVWKCGLCLEQNKTRKQRPTKQDHTVETGMTGLDYLKLIEKEKCGRQLVDGECPSQYDELKDLWKEWNLNEEQEMQSNKERSHEVSHERSHERSHEQLQETSEEQEDVYSQDLFSNSQGFTPARKKLRRGF